MNLACIEAHVIKEIYYSVKKINNLNYLREILKI